MALSQKLRVYDPKPYEFVGKVTIHGPKPYEFIGTINIYDPNTLNS